MQLLENPSIEGTFLRIEGTFLDYGGRFLGL